MSGHLVLVLSVMGCFVLFGLQMLSPSSTFWFLILPSLHNQIIQPLHSNTIPSGPSFNNNWVPTNSSTTCLSSHFNCPKSSSGRILGRAHWNKSFRRFRRKSHWKNIPQILAPEVVFVFLFLRSGFLDIKSLANMFFFSDLMVCQSYSQI